MGNSTPTSKVIDMVASGDTSLTCQAVAQSNKTANQFSLYANYSASATLPIYDRILTANTLNTTYVNNALSTYQRAGGATSTTTIENTLGMVVHLSASCLRS